MNQPEKEMSGVLTLILIALLLIVPVTAAGGTTELHIVKYANDEETILNEKTVDYHWLQANLPVYGDGVTRYYHQGPVFEVKWEEIHPGEPYDGWNPGEDVQISILYKGDFGAVRGTDLKDICDYIGGAEEGDMINTRSRDGYSCTYPYSIIYDPDPRQGPAVLCWYSGNGSGPAAQDPQGSGYPDTGYTVGMRMIFFADTSTNPWGWHIFGNNDMKECWNEDDWHYGGSYPSAAGTSPKWVNDIRIYSQLDPPAPVVEFSADVTSGTAPLTVSFSDLSTGDPEYWSWEFGDGETSDDQNPVCTYSDAGNYSVTLTAENDNGPNSTTKDSYIVVTGAIPESGGNSGSDSHYMSYSQNEDDYDDLLSSENTNTEYNDGSKKGGYDADNLIFLFEDRGIYEIDIPSENLTGTLNISCENTLPSDSIPEVPGMAYGYYNISASGVNVSISNAFIRFSIPVTWMEDNRINDDELLMYHYEGNWTPLLTRQISPINGYYRYEAETQSFSLFAISGNDIVVTEGDNSVTAETKAGDISSTGTGEEKPTDELSLYVIIAVAIILVIISVVFCVFRHPRKDKSTKEEKQ